MASATATAYQRNNSNIIFKTSKMQSDHLCFAEVKIFHGGYQTGKVSEAEHCISEELCTMRSNASDKTTILCLKIIFLM